VLRLPYRPFVNAVVSETSNVHCAARNCSALIKAYSYSKHTRAQLIVKVVLRPVQDVTTEAVASGNITVAVSLNQGTTITGGAVTFEVSDTTAFTNAYTVVAAPSIPR